MKSVHFGLWILSIDLEVKVKLENQLRCSAGKCRR